MAELQLEQNKIPEESEQKKEKKAQDYSSVVEKYFSKFSVEEKIAIVDLCKELFSEKEFRMMKRVLGKSVHLYTGDIISFKKQLVEKKDIEEKELRIPLNITKKNEGQKEESLVEMMKKNEGQKEENEGQKEENEGQKEENKEILWIQHKLEETRKNQESLADNVKKHTSSELENKIATLPATTRDTLQKNNISTQEWASFLLSRDKIGTDASPESQDFLQSLKALEKNLGIPETTAGGYIKSFEPQAETFTQNPDLVKYTEKSQDFSAFDQLEYLPQQMAPEAEQKLIQTFGSSALKEFNQKITPLLTKEEKLLTEQEKQALDNYQKQVDQLKHQIESKAKNFMKAGVTNAPITAILQYLDSESLGNKTLTNLLEKPQSGSFAEIHQEGENQILHFQGKIDGNPLTFYYNLNNPNASLECDDCLYQDPVSKTFTLGKSSGARTKLNIQMPTTEQLASNLKNICSPEKFQKIITSSSSPAEYQQQFSDLISSTIEKSFSDENLIKTRLQRHTEKNLTIQTFQSSLIPPEIQQQLSSGGQLNTNPATKQLFKLLDNTTENSTSSELQTLRSSLKKRENLMQSPDKINTIQDPILRSSLQKCADARLKRNDFQAWNTALVQLFNLFTKQKIGAEETNTSDPNYILNIADFSNFVDHLDKPDEHITDNNNLQNFSPTFCKKYEMKTEMMTINGKTSLQRIEEALDYAFA